MNNVFNLIIHWRNENLARRQLVRLNNRMLDDIGMTRGDIDRVAAHFG